tara:strand:- start:31 stop:198 length:168 start_codon:yes stop_codon:yes gene_type:complete
MSWWKKIVSFFSEETETVRARNKKGQYVADNPNTPNVNEAYTKVPKKRGRPRKKK